MTKLELDYINSINFDSNKIDMTYANVYTDGECPHCHYAIDFKHKVQIAYHDLSDEDEYDWDEDTKQYNFNIFTLHKCPHCHKGFVIQHKMKVIDLEHEEFEEIFHIPFPKELKEFEVNEKIHKVSEKFCEVYKQSLQTKDINCTEIYGMGLRKAMECLVKDFALYMNVDTEEQIASKTLYKCIEDYIQDDEIKTLANACRKIGNNETHWKNENETDDLNLLEQIIESLIYFISKKITVLESQNYLKTH